MPETSEVVRLLRMEVLVDRALLLVCCVVAAGALPLHPAATAGLLLAVWFLVRKKLEFRGRFGLLFWGLLLIAGMRAELHYGRARAVYEAARSLASPPAECEGILRIVASPQRHGDHYGALVVIESGWCGDRAISRGTVARLSHLPEQATRDARYRARISIAPVHLFANVGGEPRLVRVARTGAGLSGRVLAIEEHQEARSLASWIDRARAHVRRRILATYHSDASALGRALVLGETDLDERTSEAFRVSGLSHLLAVSGTHLVIAVLSLCALLERVLSRSAFVLLRARPASISAAVAIPLSLLYCDFAGGSGSVQRAAIMVIAAAVARVAERRPSGARCFVCALVGGWILDPLVLLDVSFLLSAVATAGLLVFAPFSRRAFGDGPKISASLGSLARARRALLAAMLTTLSATVACMPVIASLSPTVPVAGVLANLVAAPAGEIVALPFALLHAVSGPLPPLEAVAALLASGALRIVHVVAQLATDTGVALAVPSPTAGQVAALASGGLAVVLQSTLRRRALFAAGGLLLLVGLELHQRRAEAPAGELRLSALDVGQGDALLVDLPDGRLMMVDAGGMPGSGFDIGRRVVLPALRQRRRDRVDVFVLSHPHPDHYEGLRGLLEEIPITEIWDTGEALREPQKRRAVLPLLTLAQERGTVVKYPDQLCGQQHPAGAATIEVLAPCPGADPELSTNDASFVLRVELGLRSMLLVGDLEDEGEQRLLSLQAPLSAEVLKVGHHGSRTSSGQDFLAAVQPAHALISCGVRNRFGHPATDVLDRLHALGTNVLRTDVGGERRIRTDGGPWIVER